MLLRLSLTLLGIAALSAPVRAASFASATPPAAISKTYGSKPFEFGYLTVPEDHFNPLGKSIQLAVVILRATDASGNLPPVFFLTGGPGGSSTEDAVYFDVFPALQKKHDVVLIDQRGTGYSNPFLNLRGSTYSAARQSLIARGINITAYNTTQNAWDIADLRVALGYEKVILFGNSYGTFLAQEVMRNHPTGIAAVVIDGVLPATNAFIPDFNTDQLHGLNALFKDVRKNGPARRVFPDFARTYFDLLRELKRGPIRFKGNFRITLDDFQGTVQAMMQSSERIRVLPLIVSEIAARHDTPWLRRFFSGFVSGPRDFADGMYFSTLGTDWNQPGWLKLTKEMDAKLRPKIFRQANAASSLSVIYGVDAWNVPYAPRDTRTPLVSDIPTLLLTGQMESQTPAKGALTVSRGLSRATNLFFPRSGHITGFTPGPGLDALVQFVNDPTRRPVYSLASLTRNRFYLTSVPAEARGREPEVPTMKFMR